MEDLEQEAQAALEAQLRLTQQHIEAVLTTHPHWTDDCGEYLRASLELSGRLMRARENGLEVLLEEIRELAATVEVDLSGAVVLLAIDDYAGDGRADELDALVRALA